MRKLSRRSFIAGASTLPLLALGTRRVSAQPPVLTRHDALSPDGQAMLKKYADAVAKMSTTAITPEGRPISWLFQWYTHWVRADRTKAAEIARVYPAASPERALAEEMWSTCQAHDGSAAAEPFFLPWHRMYVYYFERIVRGVLNDQTFTLPYWNYSASDPAVHGIMPKEFRLPNDAPFKSLYRSNRNRRAFPGQQIPNVNNGEPIDRFSPTALSLAALKQGSYLPSGALQGFNMALDRGLHGNVHGLIGDTTNMGSVPWAARDAIFWMHHCNIDRLWASWNRNGGKNPTGAWLTQSFIFADANGSRVSKQVQDVDDLAKLGYTYDRFEPAPPVFSPITMTAAPTAPTVHVASGPVTLGAAPVRKTLEPRPSPTAAPAPPLPERVAALPASRRLYLVLRGLRAQAHPGVLYHVYLDLPADVSPASARATEHLAGAINFFDAVPHADHAAPAPAAPGSDVFVSFDVTEIARSLHRRGILAARPALTIAPVGRPYAAAQPLVGEISVVEQ